MQIQSRGPFKKKGKKLHVTEKANHSTINEPQTLGGLVQERMLHRTQRNIARWTVQDLCDFCLKPKYVPRWALALRARRGYKFLCPQCNEAGNGSYGPGVLPCAESPRAFHKIK